MCLTEIIDFVQKKKMSKERMEEMNVIQITPLNI